MEDRTGRRLDNYRLLRYLGSGSFGVVYLAEHITHRTPVAIKIFPRFADKDLPAFLNEARIIRLKHPHILPVLDFGIDKSEPFIVTEYIPAGTVRGHYPKGSRLPVGRVGPYIQQIASALQFAHDEKLVHRDVKPENILMRSDTDLVLGDFGVVAIAHSSSSLPAQTTAGTLHYMAPEQIKGKAGLASDQYALAVIAYEWLCGERPFQGSVGELIGQHLESPPPPLRSKRPDLSRTAEDVIWRALSKDPNRRYPSVQIFADALEKACNPPTQSKGITREIPNIFQVLAPLPVENTSASRKTPAPAEPQPDFKEDESLLPQTQVMAHQKHHPLAQTITPPNELDESVLASKFQQGSSFSSLSRSNPSSLAGLETAKPRRTPLYALLILILLVALILAAGISGAIYLVRMNQQRMALSQGMAEADDLLTQASRETALNPGQALRDLALAQKNLRALQQQYGIDASQATQFNRLQQQLAIETRNAMLQYNHNALITLLPCSGSMPASTLETSSTDALAVITTTNSPGYGYYTLGADGHIYQISQTPSSGTEKQSQLVSAFAPSSAPVVGIASLNNQLVAVSQATGASNSYTLEILQPDARGHLHVAQTQPLTSAQLPGGQAPPLVAAWSNGNVSEIFVVLNSLTNPHIALIKAYFLISHETMSVSSSINLDTHVAALTVQANRLFLSLEDGTLESSLIEADYTFSNLSAVLTAQMPALPLTGSPQSFTTASTVPVVATNSPGTNQPLRLAEPHTPPLLSSTLTSSTDGTEQVHLFISDPANQRVLDFALPASTHTFVSVTPSLTSDTSLVLTLAQQYVAPGLFASVTGLDSDNQARFYVLNRPAATQESLMIFATGASNACAA